MSGATFDKRVCRPRQALDALGRRFPQAWRQIDELRADRGKNGLPAWPDWCFLPLAGAYAMVSAHHRLQVLNTGHMPDVALLGALAAWRLTQGIYRFDADVFDAVRDTQITQDIPCSILYRMPEWCVYVETPGMTWLGGPLYGVFAHLEWDANTSRTELRLLTDTDTGLQPLVLHLGVWPITEAIDRALAEAAQNAAQFGHGALGAALSMQSAATHPVGADLLGLVQPALSMLLYICSQAQDVGSGDHRPANPAPKKVRGIWRLFPADRPTTWDVGVRMGAALRRAQASSATADQGHSGQAMTSPRPHIRRAHWHGFWSGPRTAPGGEVESAAPRRFDLRWLPPIPVNVADANELAPVIRPVS